MAGSGRGGQVGGASMEAFVGQNGEGDGFFRVTGLADLGRRVDLIECSFRRGEGDPQLAAALRRDAEREWD